ncbi:MAG TPA: hypothetical protein VGR97_04095 [Candidatus Acidoferrales bacterium]|nr:hypothetical protein [Candidatus Acidoferrales bacterium]
MRASRPALSQFFVLSSVLSSLWQTMRRDAVRYLGAISLLSAALGIVSKPATAQSQSYSFAVPPVPVGTNQFVSGMNDKGEFVGGYVDAAGNQNGFLYSNGQFTTIDVPGAQYPGAGLGTIAVAVNDEEQVVGKYVTAAQGTTPQKIHGFLWQAGQVTLLPDYPLDSNSTSPYTQPYGINNAGEIVGSYVGGGNFDGGFLYFGGVYTQIQYPNIPQLPPSGTVPSSINDSGQIVGEWFYNPNYPFNGGVTHAFSLSGGQYSTVDASGCAGGNATSVNNAGTIVLNSCGSSFLLTGRVYKPLPFAYPNASSTFAAKINNLGWILGSATVSGQNIVFVAMPLALVDPVPDLLSQSAPATISGPSLAAKGLSGRVVQGIAADGVAEVLVRIPAINVGDQFTITLFNDQQTPTQSSSTAEDGALDNPGGTTFTQSQVTATAIAVTNASGQQVPMAFAVYRGPLDFARQNSDTSYKTGTCGAVSNTDDNLACRSVSLKIQNQTQGTTGTLPITILRPPLVMVHGLWDNAHAWDAFSPLVSGNTVDSRFSVGRPSYDFPVKVAASNPSYSSRQLKNVSANSLGFAYNASVVVGQVNGWIVDSFKTGKKNPLGIPVAAVQADIIAHSMGGDITRTIVLPSVTPTFLSNDTFAQGNIHKLITIDTPHLGSPLAAQLVTSQEHCLDYWILANLHKFVFSSVALPGGSLVSGAVGDLSPSSLAVSSISSQGPHPLPTALIAGVYTNFQSLQTSFVSNAIFLACGYSDPLAQAIISPAGWQAIFSNQPNDAIVAQASQLNGLDSTFVFQGFVHSPGTENLGFSKPSVLDPDSVNPIPIVVIHLLNTPVTDSSFKSVNP